MAKESGYRHRFLVVAGRCVGALLILVIALLLAIQLPATQRLIARRVISVLQEEAVGGRITFQDVSIHPFRGLVLTGLTITDNAPYPSPVGARIDTLAHAGSVVVTFSIGGLFRHEGLQIGRASIHDLAFNLTRYQRPGDSLATTNLARVFNLPPRREKEEYTGHLFDAKKIEADEIHFRYINYPALETRKIPREYGIDWADIDVLLSLRAHDASYKGGIIQAVIDNLNLKEKSGYQISRLSTAASVSSQGIHCQDFLLSDRWSEIFFRDIRLRYAGWSAFSHFLHEVDFEAALRNSQVDSRSVSYFAPSLRQMQVHTELEADFSGSIDNLDIRELRFLENRSQVSGQLDGHLSGLPQVQQLGIQASIQGLQFTTRGIRDFIAAFAPRTVVDLSSIGPAEHFRFDGQVNGTLDDMRIRGTVLDGKGSLKMDSYLRGVISGDGIRIGGDLQSRAFPAGKILGTSALGDVSLQTRIHARIGGGQALQADFDTLVIQHIHLLGYDYHQVIGKGDLSENSFNGRIACMDPGAHFIFRGYADLPGKATGSAYNFDLTVGGMDLHRLGLPGEGRSDITLHSNVDFHQAPDGSMRGRIDIDTLVLRNDAGSYNIGAVQLRAKDSANDIRLHSDFAEARFNGSASIIQFINDFQALTLERDLPALLRGEKQWSGNDYSLSIRLKDVSPLTDFFLKELYIENGTSLRADIDELGLVQARIQAPILAYGKNYIRHADIRMSGDAQGLETSLKGERMDVAGIEMLRPTAFLLGRNNQLGLNYSFDNLTDPANKGQVMLTGSLARNEKDSLMLHLRIDPSTAIWYEGAPWRLSSSDIHIGGDRIRISDRLRAENGEQWIELSGGISPKQADSLRLDMQAFDLALVNSLTDLDLDIQGRVGGFVELISPYRDRFALLSSLKSRESSMGGEAVGDLGIESRWNEESHSFDFDIANQLRGENTLRLNGKFFPSGSRLDADAWFDHTSIAYAYPLLKSIFTEVGGSLSGHVRAYGPISRLKLDADDTVIEDGRMRLGFTGVTYYLNGPVGISEAGITFNGSTLSDGADGRAEVSGGLYYDLFRNMSLNVDIDRIRQMRALQLEAKDNDIFYGSLGIGGQVSIRGPLSHVVLNIDATTSGDGEFHIPLNYATDASSGLLTFKEEQREEKPQVRDRFEQRLAKMQQRHEGGSEFDVFIRSKVTPGVEAYLEIDPASGNIVTGRGSGDLDISYRSQSGAFTMGGDYRLSSGNYHFSAMNIATRDFEIQDGSTVRFNGDIMDTDLDVNAVYRTKTSLSTLLADSTLVRTTVDCHVHVSDKLSNPRVELGLEFPEVTDPTTLTRAESALNTQDQIQKQFLSLLISNTFLPAEQSGIVNGSNSTLLSNMTEMMNSQLNAILQQLDIPLDLGFNYQPTESGNDIFDVAVSTQLFDNRVIINGTLGNKQYSSSESNTEMAGDLDVDIKLNRRGSLRLNLFSHSADQYRGYLDNSQRNGGGITVQKEFSTFRELLRSLIEGRGKRKAREREELESAATEERRVIHLTHDESQR